MRTLLRFQRSISLARPAFPRPASLTHSAFLRSTTLSPPNSTSPRSIELQQRRTCCCQQTKMVFSRQETMEAGGSPALQREVLPTHVRPTHYHVTVEPDFTSFTYHGTVVIDLDVNAPTSSISLNSFEIDIHSSSLAQHGQQSQDSSNLSYDKDSAISKIEFRHPLQAGTKATLTQTFTGKLNDEMAGFYRASYKAKDGRTQYIASTQMEPTDARRAFPCFDEPALKAEWTITLIAASHHTCLSNMDVESEKMLDSSRKAVTFKRSPPMSSYLVAFIVGELNYIETLDYSVPIRVYATPDKDIEHGRFSLDLAAKTLAFYDQEFGQKYSLPKMDMVAVPDFSAGAMENWGLVTYRVVDLLFDPQTSGVNTKIRVAEVVQHELAHQWFGNLVTMDFWDGLWLNEGFATWMSWYACNKHFPEWRVWDSFVTDTLQGALGLDSLRSSHPIEVPVKRADEVNQIFDAISYSKGSCIIVMVSKYLGEDVFMAGIRKYIERHKYGNTRTEDLWAALAEVSGKPVREIMDIWTKKIGFPVVSVTEQDGRIHLRQNRFLRTADVKPDEDHTLYPVFLGLRSKAGVDDSLTFSTREQDIVLPKDGFFKLNADHCSFYRTAYSPEQFLRLGQAAQAGQLSTRDRAGMLSDAGALAASGYQKTSSILSLLQSLKEEKEHVVWEEMLTRISGVRTAWQFESQNVKDALKALMLDLTAEKAHQKGWKFHPDDDEIEALLKALLFGSAGQAGDPEIIEASLKMFELFAQGDRSAIHPNIRASVYSIVLKYSSNAAKAYDVLLQEYLTAAIADERNAALRALGRVGHNAELTQRTLALPLSDDVKAQDVYLPIGGLRTTREGSEALWGWMTKHWDALNKKCPASLGGLSHVVGICCGGFTKEEHVRMIREWFAGRSTKGFDRTLEQCIDAITARAGYVHRDQADVETWLATHGYLK